MNIEQAIEKLKMYKPGVRYGKALYVANAMAIKALEKQIHKKPDIKPFQDLWQKPKKEKVERI